MVTILSVALIALTGMEQERRTSPLMCTEQAPHCATPQPYLVPVRPACSRIAHSRGVSASTCTSRSLPLMLSFAMDSSRICLGEFYPCSPPDAVSSLYKIIHETPMYRFVFALLLAANAAHAQAAVQTVL